MSAVRFGGFDPAAVKTVDSRTSIPDASRVRAGDVLMTRANTRDLVGAVCIVDSVPDDYFLCDKTLRLVPHLERVAAEFLVEVLQSNTARSQIELSATGTSASMKNISQISIKSLQIPLPAMEDQVALAAILAESRVLAEALREEARALSEVRSALLDSLLSRQRSIPISYDKLLELAG